MLVRTTDFRLLADHQQAAYRPDSQFLVSGVTDHSCSITFEMTHSPYAGHSCPARRAASMAAPLVGHVDTMPDKSYRRPADTAETGLPTKLM